LILNISAPFSDGRRGLSQRWETQIAVFIPIPTESTAARPVEADKIASYWDHHQLKSLNRINSRRIPRFLVTHASDLKRTKVMTAVWKGNWLSNLYDYFPDRRSFAIG
jgi:hypothetical protein